MLNYPFLVGVEMFVIYDHFPGDGERAVACGGGFVIYELPVVYYVILFYI